MRRPWISGISGSIGLLTALLAAACAVAPRRRARARGGRSAPRRRARAPLRDASVPEVFENPEMRDKVRGLFGSDWSPAAQGGGKLEYGAAAYFPANSSLRMLRIENRDYIAIMGCVETACATHRGLVLIQLDGDELWARLDEGGFSRYYGHGLAMTDALVSPAFIDSAWRAVERVEHA